MRSPSSHGRRWAVCAALFALTALACTQIPLLNALGYESSFLMALLAMITAGPITIADVRHAYHAAAVPEDPLRSFGRSLLRNLLLLLPPLLILAANALVVKNCALLEGIAFYVLLPVVGAVFSSALGLFCAVHYRRPVIVYAAVCLLTLGVALAEGYWTPAIFSYNLFYGYFPGLTYDEALGIGRPLLLFRLFTLLVAGMLTGMAVLIVRRSAPADTTGEKGTRLLRALWEPGVRPYTAAGILLLLAVSLFRCELGFASTSAYIRRVLGGEFRTAHCTIFYAAQSMSDEEIRRVAAEHEFLLEEVLRAFSLPPRGTLTSFVYPSAEEKMRLTGAGETDIAKPWSGQVHVSRQSLGATLEHEMIHVVAGRFGLPVIRASLSTGLVEGLPMAVEWDWGNRTLHQYAAAMRRFGLAPDIRPLLGFAGFVTQSSSVSYVTAGSFCRYLIDRYGMRQMMRLYRHADYRESYGRTLDDLVEEWHRFLDTRVEVRAEDRGAVEALFRRPPIFRKVCARVVAARNHEAAAHYGSRDYGAAAALYRLSYEEAGGDDALSGYLSCALRLGQYEVLTAAYDTLILGDPHPLRYLPLFLSIGDAFAASGRPERARGCFDTVRAADFSSAATEGAALRLGALDDSTARSTVFALLLSDLPDSARIAVLDSAGAGPLGAYLRGRVLMRLQRFAEAAEVLGTLDLSTRSAELEASRLTMLGTALLRLQRYEESRAAFWLSLNAVRTLVREAAVQRWIDRCEWLEAHGLPENGRTSGTAKGAS